MKLTPTGLKALQIISDQPGIGITEFSKQLWPDHALWKVPKKDGKCFGYKIIRTGQDYLSKLRHAGWIAEKFAFDGISKKNRRFFITEKGKAELHAKTFKGIWNENKNQF